MIDQQLITSSTMLEGYRITKHLGVVRGITVRGAACLEILQVAFKPCLGERSLFM